MSRMNSRHVADFRLASVGGAENDDSLCRLVHLEKGREGRGRGDWTENVNR